MHALTSVAALLLGTVLAADAPEAPPPPPLPEDRPPAATGPALETFEPEVTITTREGTTYEEYRYNGQLYRVKVIPRYGAPYYLIYDEHGNFYRSDAEPKVLVPQWVIRRF